MRPLVWFRSDLRVADNTALHEACRAATRGVVAVFVICPEQWREHDWADIKVDFILRTLECLSDGLRTRRIPLLVETVPAFDDVPDTLLEIARRHACDELFFNREYEVNERRRDRRVTTLLEREGLGVRAFTDQVIVAPGSLRTGKGDFYSVFTPFRKAWMERLREAGVPAPAGRPRAQPAASAKSGAIPEKIEGFDHSKCRPDRSPAGEREALRRLRRFTAKRIGDYANARDEPAVDGTSTLSPYLAVGAISPRQCLHAAVEANNGILDGHGSGAAVWISELVWREFYRHVCVGFPRISKHRPFKEATDRIRWRRHEGDFTAWCAGRTGVPIVDAGMRQLAETGWMHNRLRMVTAMFLTKDLFIDWRWGERHFMRHLVDGDLASNNGGWQWSASTGTDAAPYFRIFNPWSQSRKIDPKGTFIRRCVPELAGVEDRALHDPRGVGPSVGYPRPIVDHAKARERVLAAFKRI